MSVYKKTSIDGVYVIEPVFHKDNRGYFYESFNAVEFKVNTGIDFNPVQENISKSSIGVLRGLHFQNPPHEQAKLVSVVKGIVLDVAVDLRLNSPTFGKYEWLELSEKNKKQFFIPKGFAHGFLVLSDEAIFQYKVDDYWHPECEDGTAWDDKDINIDWESLLNLIPNREVILSEKDKNRKSLSDYINERIKDLSAEA